MELFKNEFVAKNDLKVFMFCGIENKPKSCLCGCGLDRLFNDEEQTKNFYKKGLYRFFHNDTHKKRYIKLNK